MYKEDLPLRMFQCVAGDEIVSPIGLKNESSSNEGLLPLLNESKAITAKITSEQYKREG